MSAWKTFHGLTQNQHQDIKHETKHLSVSHEKTGQFQFDRNP